MPNFWNGLLMCYPLSLQTRKTAAWLAEAMSRDGHAVALLSGELEIDQRINIINRFRDGKEKVLITTNVLARGIDVEQVNSDVLKCRPYTRQLYWISTLHRLPW